MGGCCSAEDIDTPYVNISQQELSPSAVVETNNLSFDGTDTNITNDIFAKEKLIYPADKQCDENRLLQSDCICIQRLLFILSKYDEYFLFNSNEHHSPYRFIHADFGKYYSQSNLLNDYIHLLQYHSNSESQNINDEKKYIKNDLFNITTDCIANECDAVKRILDTNYLHSNSSDIEDIVSQHLLDIIHSNLCHSDYIQSQLNSTKFATKAMFSVAKKTKLNLNYYQITPSFEYDILSCNKNNESIFVEKKHSNLKEEIMENELFTLSVNEWNFIAYKAEKYLNTAYKEDIRINAYIEHNYDEYTIYDMFRDQFGLNHIICLLLLSDFNELAVSLRSSYLRQSTEESHEALSKRHANYWHLARTLKVIAQLFGVMRCKSNYGKRPEQMNTLWHCIILPESTIIPWLRVKWNFPVSTTKNLSILDNTKQGIIIALDEYDVCVFDCRWISKFQFEKEVLAMDYKRGSYGCSEKLRYMDNKQEKRKIIITNPLPIHYVIHDTDCLQVTEENTDYIRSIHSFIQIINTFFIKPWGGLKCEIQDWFGPLIGLHNHEWKNYYQVLKKYQSILINLIHNRFKTGATCSVYAKKVIDAYFKNKTELIIDFWVLKQSLYRKCWFLLDLIVFGIDYPEPISWRFARCGKDKTFLKRINIQFICNLFPNCNNLEIYNVKDIGDIDESFMEWLFDELRKMEENDQIENELLIYGYIRMNQRKWIIAMDVIDLILLYYPRRNSKIEKISFMKCIGHSEEESIIKMQDFVPLHWNIQIEKRNEYSYRDNNLLVSFKHNM